MSYGYVGPVVYSVLLTAWGYRMDMLSQEAPPSSRITGTSNFVCPMRKQSESPSTRGRGIARDPEAYPDPHKFNPDRWLDEQGNFKEDMSFCNYGFGRRCVRHRRV